MLWNALIFSAALAAGPDDAAPGMLAPVGAESLFVTPDQNTPLHLRIASGSFPDTVDYLVRDYHGARITTGQARRAGAEVALEVRLPRGFFEIEIPATHQRIGLVSLPSWDGDPDPFFAIDGGLSWLVREDSVREGLIAAAHRCGIGMVRERLSWGGVNPSRERWNWDTPQRFETLRRTYERHHVPILELAHDAPRWLGMVAKYPDDLAGAAESWRRIAERWKATWGAVEAWNRARYFLRRRPARRSVRGGGEGCGLRTRRGQDGCAEGRGRHGELPQDVSGCLRKAGYWTAWT